jgi:polar amino acid transport system substrate-binding protein
MKRLACIVLLIGFSLGALPAGAQTIERIRETGEIRLGFRTDAAPLSFLGEGNQPRGYAPLVCARVAELLAIDLHLENLDANFIPIGSEDRFEKVASGEIDLLCGAATITISRREIVDFSIPIYVDGAAVLLPVDAEKDLAALTGKSIGVRAGTTTEEILGNSLATSQIAADIIPFESHDAGLKALETGQIAAYFGDQSILHELFSKSNMSERFAMSENTLTIEKQGLALRRGDADFRLAVDRAISALYANGTMRETFQSAFPGAEPGLGLKALFLVAPELP